MTLKQEEKASSHLEVIHEGFLKKIMFSHSTAVEKRKRDFQQKEADVQKCTEGKCRLS